MTDRELMQQALEALDCIFWPLHLRELNKVVAAMNALRERLAQPEQESVKFNCTVVDDDHPNGVPLSQWGKQQKQKPFCYHDGRNIVGKEYADHSDVFPLYTAPTQRKPLTAPQIHELDWPDGVAFEEILEFARAIERAHGIGGEE